MKEVYFEDINVFEKEGVFEVALSELPDDQQERALRYRSEIDRKCFVLGRMLLKKGLKKFDLQADLNDLGYQKSGKPFLSSVCFSISHSKGKVICVVSDEGEIGVDIEVDRPLELNHFEAFFKKEEWLDILGAEEPKKRFYWYWTRKEAVIKATGKTLTFLHTICLDAKGDLVVVDEVKWRLETLDLGDDLFGALCLEMA